MNASLTLLLLLLFFHSYPSFQLLSASLTAESNQI
jgi:hypothetical protein